MTVENERQEVVRRKACEALLVYDLHTGLPMGQILDMSVRGMKLMNDQRFTVRQVYYCRMPLDKKISGRDEVYFDAECRWCKLNDSTSWYNSGFKLRYPTPEDAEIVRKLIRSWMINHVEKFNNPNSKMKKKKGRLLQKILSVNVW